MYFISEGNNDTVNSGIVGKKMYGGPDYKNEISPLCEEKKTLPDTVMAALFMWLIAVMITSGIRDAGSLRGTGRQRAPVNIIFSD